MTILVTGATGFIGKALAESLVASGEKVRVLARRTANVATAGLIDVEVLEGDITDAEAVDRAVDGIDTVYAIAGTFREPNLTDDRYRAVNVDAVRLMMAAATPHGVRRIAHCSTVGIHGNVVGPPASETTPLRPDGIYEITKAEGDQLALSYAGNGVETVAVRPAPVYGPGDTRLVKLYQLAGRRRVILLGDGQPRYHMIYIDDLVTAFRLAAEVPDVSGEAFIIAGAEMPTLEEVIREIGQLSGHLEQTLVRLPAAPLLLAGDLCEWICRPLGISPPIYRRRIEFFINNRAYDTSKARSRLGFSPKVTLRDGLARTLAWYRDQGLLAN
jgi:nucleoside-diphosphate-sugar epimerase